MAKGIKVWRASKNATAGITVRDNTVNIVGGKHSALEVGRSSISAISKSFSFGMSSANIRTGGFFVMGEDWATMIPSTIVTPMPSRLPFPPLGFVTSLALTLPIFMAFAAAAQVG